jgi:hypothetical protein
MSSRFLCSRSLSVETGDIGVLLPVWQEEFFLEIGKHMNRILEVNTEYLFALVESGVTYQGII